MSESSKLFSIVIVLTGLSMHAQQSTPAVEPPTVSVPDVAIATPYEWSLPKYPKDALRDKVQGEVIVRLTLDEKGRINNMALVTGEPRLAEATLRALENGSTHHSSVTGTPFK